MKYLIIVLCICLVSCKSAESTVKELTYDEKLQATPMYQFYLTDFKFLTALICHDATLPKREINQLLNENGDTSMSVLHLYFELIDNTEIHAAGQEYAPTVAKERLPYGGDYYFGLLDCYRYSQSNPRVAEEALKVYKKYAIPNMWETHRDRLYKQIDSVANARQAQ